MMRRYLGVSVFLLLSTSAGALQNAPAAKPNVVLIIADDLGYGDLSSYGAPDLRTPNLDRLASDGVRLTDYYSNAPACTPMRAALITGRYQQRVLLERPLSTNARSGSLETGLPVTGRSLPQLMKNAGYATGLVGKWHLGFKPTSRFLERPPRAGRARAAVPDPARWRISAHGHQSRTL